MGREGIEAIHPHTALSLAVALQLRSSHVQRIISHHRKGGWRYRI